MFFLLALPAFAQQVQAPVQTEEFREICMPLHHLKINSVFGYRIHPVTGRIDFHRGVDLAARSEPVYCIMRGTVYETGTNPILGKYVKVSHGELFSIYGHLSLSLVKVGMPVEAGSILGITGATGRTTGEHLHFSVTLRGIYLDPMALIHGWLQSWHQPIN